MLYWGLEGQRGAQSDFWGRMKPWDLKVPRSTGGFKATWKRDLERHSCCVQVMGTSGCLVSQGGERS